MADYKSPAPARIPPTAQTQHNAADDDQGCSYCSNDGSHCSYYSDMQRSRKKIEKKNNNETRHHALLLQQ